MAVKKKTNGPTVKMSKRRKTGSGYTRNVGYYGQFTPLGSELKFFDTTGTLAPVPAAGAILEDSVHHIVAGTGESQRVGRKVTLKSFHARIVSNLIPSGSSSSDDGIRIIVYWDKQCNGATAAVTDILETANYKSFNNLSNKNRFMVLADKVVDISATAADSAFFGQRGVTSNMNIKCNLPVEFSSTTGAIAEIRSNNIGLMAITDNGLINISYTLRVRYQDN